MLRIIGCFLFGMVTSHIYCQGTFKAMTYNIRWANPNDGVNYWENRSEKVFEIISDHNPDIFGLQEVVKSQLDDLKRNFSSYQAVGVGRDDGLESGEYSPVFVRKTRFSIEKWETVWLSETPDIPSKGWDAALPRIATFCYLLDKETEKRLLFINTHYDHVGEEARLNSSKLLIDRIQANMESPLILQGDLNYQPDASGYMVFSKVLQDSHKTAEATEAEKGTFKGFAVNEDRGPRIDYIFSNKLKTLTYSVDDRNDGQNYPSDHLPIIVEFSY